MNDFNSRVTSHNESPLLIALVGNPNSGKSSVFCSLTGKTQAVGNYPGVTVEIKEVACSWENRDLIVVDLPGVYSLTPNSEDEIITRDYLNEKKPDVIINVLDAANLCRNLFLTTQLIELHIPMVLALNKSDCADAYGITFHEQALEKALQAPVIKTVGTSRDSCLPLFSEAIKAAEKPYLHEIPLIDSIPSCAGCPNCGGCKKLCNSSTLDAQTRYRWICSVVAQSEMEEKKNAPRMIDRMDAFLTHPITGIPVFLVMMFLLFFFTFTLAEYPTAWIEMAISALSEWVLTLFPEDSSLAHLCSDGIIGGVGAVITFLPGILLLFTGMAIMEESGYMARAATVMDRIMRTVGLHGKCCIPMLLGLGCSVPAIIAVRTIENRRDRLVTMFIIPLMSCAARLPIYTLIILAFFPLKYQPLMMMVLYLAGVLMALFLAFILRNSFCRGENTPLILELPMFAWPRWNVVIRSAGMQGYFFLRKAATVILAASILLWAAGTFPKNPNINASPQEQLEYTIIGRLGHLLEPAVKPMGADWKVATALVAAIPAKEIFVAQIGIIYNLNDVDENSESLREKLRERYSPLTGLCIALCCLLCAPCAATFAVIWRESGSLLWAVFQWVGTTLLGWVVAVGVYQVGRLFYF